MKTKFSFLLCLLFGATALAGPARPISSGTFQIQSSCGPIWDSFAQQGQWFVDLNSGATNVNAWEYCDDDNSLTIAGVVQTIVFNANSNIVAFDVLVTVSNSLPSDYQISGNATNSHGEVQLPQAPAGSDAMKQTRITAEFAIADASMPPPAGSAPPYWLDPVSAGQYHIVADNEDLWAWYCWDPNSGLQPAGNFQVPAWNLNPSDIPPGGTAQVLMQFSVTGTGMPISDYRHSVIRASQQMGLDVLYNRHPSLKISHWLDTLLVDYSGFISTPFPPFWTGEEIEYIYASDASVFYNVEEEQEAFDFGDAPDWVLGTAPGDYQTTLADNGAYHNIVVGAPYFDDGSQSDQPDGEPDGQPDLNALGDDNNGTSPDDEDGVAFPIPLVVGQNSAVDITVDDGAGGLGAGGGFVDAWIDWNADGDWADSNEQIFSGWATQGLNQVNFTVPASAVAGQIFARFRINSQNAGLLPTGGPSIDGEVEDHEIYIEEEQLLDWGDAPDPTYPTLAASSGANHLLGQGIYLGASVDPDLDGQPDLQAMGDDTNLLYAGVAYPPGDEDGVIFVTPVFPGTVAQVNVIASVPALLNAWIDFNGDGSWATAGDQVFTDLPLVAGTNSLTISIPTTAVSGQTFARFRYSTMAGLPPTGYASDGEVEDHLVTIEGEQGVDWGDAPDPTYPTLVTNNGAHHILLGGFYLGTSIDSDPDGQPNIAASGDDTDGNDDEDGIVYLSNLMPGGCTRVDVAASSPGLLDGWLDFNADGDWLDAGERVFTGQILNTGTNTLTFVVPLSATNISPASTYMRLRFSSGGVSSFTGLALDGEVEDYKVTILDNYSGDDWGDAPTNFPAGSSTGYPTVGSGGAVHVILTGLQLGGSVDPEINGQPDPTATGDDIMGIDDEDGVVFKTKLIAGNWCTIDVLAGVAGGSLDAWIDFNADGAWSSTEQIANAASLSPGVNTIAFYMPQPSALGLSFARFRLSTAGGLPPAGGAPVSGEVEDYMVNLYQPQPYTNIIITNIMINTSNAMATIQWNALNNITYQLQMSTNLMSNAWANVGSTIMGPTNSQTNAAVNTTQFYRVEAPWTP